MASSLHGHGRVPSRDGSTCPAPLPSGMVAVSQKYRCLRVTPVGEARED